LQERYEALRHETAGLAALDRPRIQFDLLRDAESEYVRNTGDKMEHWQRRMLARYTRKSRHHERRVGVPACSISRWLGGPWWTTTTPGRFGKWPIATPSRSRPAIWLENVNLSGEEIWFRTKKIRLRRRLPRPKQILLPRGLKKRKKEVNEGDWGPPDRWQRHLLLSSRGPDDRGLRALP